jgi:hypothetical protein
VTTAIITLAALALLLGGIVAALAYKVSRNADDRRALVDEATDANKLADGYRKERDANQALLDKTAAELADALARIAVVESERNEAARRARDAVVEKIRSAGVADAVRIVSDILSSPILPDVPNAARPVSGDGREGSPAVQPATAAGAAGTGGRLPKP